MPFTSSTIAPLRFFMAGLPAGARTRAIRELRERGLLPIELLRGGIVHARVAKWVLPGASVLTGTLSGVRQDGGPRARDAGDDLLLGINVTGDSGFGDLSYFNRAFRRRYDATPSEIRSGQAPCRRNGRRPGCLRPPEGGP